MQKDMVFATWLHDRIKSEGKMTSGDKAKTYRQFILIGNAVAFFVLNGVLRNLLGLGSKSTIISILLILTADIAALVFYLRVFVFREDERILDEKASDSDSFSHYIRIQGESQEDSLVLSNHVHTMLFNDGCMFCLFKCLYGANSKIRTLNNIEFYASILHIAGLYGLELRVITMREDFRKSPEYLAWVQSVNEDAIGSDAGALISIMEGYADASQELSNVPVTYFMLKARNVTDNGELSSAITRVINEAIRLMHSLRSFTSIGLDGVKELLQDFYTVEAVNLVVSNATELALNAQSGLKLSEDKISTVLVYYKNGAQDVVSPISQYFQLKEVPLNDTDNGNSGE